MNHDNFTEVTSNDAPRLQIMPPARAFAIGYNECLKRTNAAELIVCLNLVLLDLRSKGYVDMPTRVRIAEAIKKATDESR